MNLIIKVISGWEWALDAALRTVNKKSVGKHPSSKFKTQMLYSEHSPIRTVRYWIDMDGIKRFISGHLVRHKLGAEHFVGTQRTDRTGINRDKLPQSEPSIHCMDVNAAEIIFISRRRLCLKSDRETINIWREVINQLKGIDKELASVCVPECVYRGFCPEAEPCKYHKTLHYKGRRKVYIEQCENCRR